MADSLWPHGLYNPWNSLDQDTGMGILLQGIFPTEGSNPGLPCCRWILYQLSHQGSPRILEWAIYPFSRGSSWPRNWTGVSCIAGEFFTSWATRKTPCYYSMLQLRNKRTVYSKKFIFILRIQSNFIKMYRSKEKTWKKCEPLLIQGLKYLLKACYV